MMPLNVLILMYTDILKIALHKLMLELDIIDLTFCKYSIETMLILGREVTVEIDMKISFTMGV